ETIAALWSEVLGIERIGIHDDFFTLGGQSLLAVRLMTRMEARFDVRLPVRVLFEESTIAGLAERLDADRATAPSGPEAGIAPRAQAEPAPALAALAPSRLG